MQTMARKRITTTNPVAQDRATTTRRLSTTNCPTRLSPDGSTTDDVPLRMMIIVRDTMRGTTPLSLALTVILYVRFSGRPGLMSMKSDKNSRSPLLESILNIPGDIYYR